MHKPPLLHPMSFPAHLLRQLRRPQNIHCLPPPPPPPAQRLYYSSTSTTDFSHLHSELTSRRLPLLYDYLTPTHSHLLNVALADLLPSASSPTSTSTSTTTASTPPILPNTTTTSTPLPPSHHLIYFPPATPGPLLLPDGTDPLQSPGPPFVRRMWAGGALHLPAPSASKDKNPTLPLSGARAVCLETIRDVSVKGGPGKEKIFVGIERRVARTNSDDETEESIRARLARADESDFGDAELIERRNIVFMRERTREQGLAEMDSAKTKVLAPPSGERTFSVDVATDAKLLFRYSALTYNAHAIHLDVNFCREQEGHRNLLVHGPLTFTLMLTALRRCLRERALEAGGATDFGGTESGASSESGVEEVVRSIEYRNLAPLYCGEPLRICGREREAGKWDVWAETPEGGVAVKGSVRTEVAERVVGYADLAMMGL